MFSCWQYMYISRPTVACTSGQARMESKQTNIFMFFNCYELAGAIETERHLADSVPKNDYVILQSMNEN